jgi:hypothetical protein
MPCVDSDRVSNEHNTQYISKEQSDDHDHNKNETCSPFCICACCGVQINTVKHIDITFLPRTYFLKQENENYQFYFQQVLLNIWQPPQLV